MGGLETISQLRQIDPDFAAVVVSGFSEDAVLQNPAAVGFDSGIAKPFRGEELCEAIALAQQRRS